MHLDLCSLSGPYSLPLGILGLQCFLLADVSTLLNSLSFICGKASSTPPFQRCSLSTNEVGVSPASTSSAETLLLNMPLPQTERAPRTLVTTAGTHLGCLSQCRHGSGWENAEEKLCQVIGDSCQMHNPWNSSDVKVVALSDISVCG